jgi:hypothetical protein
MRIKTLSVLGLMCGLTAPAVSLAEVELSGYLTFATTYGSNDDEVGYYNELANTDHWNFDSRMNHVGVQIYSALTDKVSVTMALTAEGGQSGYEVKPEWAYGTYQFNPDWGLRMGRFKGPFYMVSDYRDVGYAYPWVRPPEEVYSTNPIKSINGLDLVFQKTVNDVNYLLEIYGGSGNNTTLANPNISVLVDPGPPPVFALIGTGVEAEFETYNSAGFSASIGTEAITFRAGYYNTKVNAPAFGILDQGGTFAGVGLIVDWYNFLLYSEYVARDTDDTQQMNYAFPDQNAWYATLGYRFASVLPYVTFAELTEGADNNFGTALEQTSVALGLRWDIDDAAAIKFEAKQIDAGESIGYYGAPTKQGLFDAPITDDGTVYTITFDTIF